MNAVIPILILLAFFTFFFLVVVYASRVQKVGPNEVLIISGRGERRRDAEAIESKFRIVTGGRAFIWPVLERVDDLSLEIMTIDIQTPDVPTVQGVPVTVDAVAQVKIGSDEASIRTASIQFLSKTQDQIRHVAHETLAGHLRAILGTLTVEQLYRDREAFAQKVQEVSGDDMASMGMEIVSFVIKDISDEEGYLEALGRPRIAQVKRDADIGEAEASRDATIRSAEARQEGESAKYRAETKIAESEKDYEVQRAGYTAEVNRRKAEAELAYTIQQNIENQKVKAEEVQIEVVAKKKQIEVQEQEISRKEKELDAMVRKPAEAERYRINTLADARQYQLQTEASGEAAAIRQRGEGEADAARAKGLAQAEVTRQQGFSEAEATQKKSDAWRTYTQAAVIQQIVDALPQIATAISAPLAKTERIVVINSGGADGQGSGASRVTNDVTRVMAELPAAVEALTGVDLAALLQSLPALQTTGQKGGEGPAPAAAKEAAEGAAEE
jgi:flotillin